MAIHVYTAAHQPATRYVDWCVPGKPYIWTNPAGRLLWCPLCGHKRLAKNMSVQAYYDQLRFFCTDKARCEATAKADRQKTRDRAKAKKEAADVR